MQKNFCLNRGNIAWIGKVSVFKRFLEFLLSFDPLIFNSTKLKAQNIFRDVAYACLQNTDKKEDDKMKTSEENTKKLLNAKDNLLKKITDVEIAKEIIKTKILDQAKQLMSPAVSPKR